MENWHANGNVHHIPGARLPGSAMAQTQKDTVSPATGAQTVPAGTTTCRYFAAVCMQAGKRDERLSDEDRERTQVEWPAWLTVCARFALCLERLSGQSALLDLGVCAKWEAEALGRRLLDQLAAHGGQALVGLAPTATLAQLAVVTSEQSLSIIDSQEVNAFLRPLSVDLLPLLRSHIVIPQDVIARLHRVGLHTLGQLSRVGEAALRRQFGACGAALANLAAGGDLSALHSVASPDDRRYQMRFVPAAAPDRVHAALPRLAREMARELQLDGRQTLYVRLTLCWEDGGRTESQRALGIPTSDGSALAATLQRLLEVALGQRSGAETAMRSDCAGDVVDARQASEIAALSDCAARLTGEITWIRVSLGGLVAPAMAQEALWGRSRQDELRQQALQRLIGACAGKYGPLFLCHGTQSQPEAIFPERRYALTPIRPADATLPMKKGRRSA